MKASRIALLLVVALGMALRVWWMVSSSSIPVSDAGGYRELALSLARGHGYRLGATGPDDIGVLTAWWVPGWPFYVSLLYRLFGEWDTVVRVGNLLLASLTITLTYVLGRMLFGHARALASAVTVALFPTLVLLPEFFLTENLALPGLLAVAILTLTLTPRWPAMASGVVLGLAIGLLTLVREQSVLLAPAVILYWLALRPLWRRLAIQVAALALGVSLIVAPWVWRNAATVGVPWVATTSGINLYVALNPEADGSWNPSVLFARWPDFGPGLQEARLYAEGRSSALAYLTSQPRQALSLAPARLTRFFFEQHWAQWWDQDASERHTISPEAHQYLLLLAYLSAVIVLTLAVYFLVRCRWWQSPPAVLLVGILTFPVLLHTLIYGMGRFHAPLIPILAIFAVVAVSRPSAIRPAATWRDVR